MLSLQEKRHRIHGLIEKLPPESLDEVEGVLSQFQDQTRVFYREGQCMVRLGGLWEGLDLDLSEENMSLTRNEVWQSLGQEES